MSERKTYTIQDKALFWQGGMSVIQRDESGELKYIYEDGSYDIGSSVDPRTPHLEVDRHQLEEMLQARRQKLAAEMTIIGAGEAEPKAFGLVAP